MLSLKNKNTIITGAGSGIGKATALLFAQQGADVHVVDIGEEQSTATANEINNSGGKATAHVCNVADQQKIIEVFNAIGKVDVLVNSAGVSHIGKADTTAEEDFDRVYKVNVKGVYNCLYAALPLMKQNKSG